MSLAVSASSTTTWLPSIMVHYCDGTVVITEDNEPHHVMIVSIPMYLSTCQEIFLTSGDSRSYVVSIPL